MTFAITVIQLTVVLIIAFFYGWGCRIAYTEWLEKRASERHTRARKQEIKEIACMSVLADNWLKQPVFGAKRVEGRWYVRLSDTDKTYSELSGLLSGR